MSRQPKQDPKKFVRGGKAGRRTRPGEGPAPPVRIQTQLERPGERSAGTADKPRRVALMSEYPRYAIMLGQASGQTVKCPICGAPYKFYPYSAADQSACPKCVRRAERNR